MGPTYNSMSPDKGLLKEWPAGGPQLLWKTTEIGHGYSMPTIGNDTVYITGDVDGTLTVFAYDLAGKQKWKGDAGPGYTVASNFPGARTSVTIDGDRLYVFSAVGRLTCLDAATGKPKWAKEAREFGGRAPNWAYAESVTIYKDWALFTPGGQNCVVALNKNTGETVWQSTGCNFPAHYSSLLPVEFAGVQVFIAATGGGIAIFDARDGKCLFSNPFAARNTASCPSPVYSDGYVFWSPGYNKGGICLKLKKVGDTVGADVAWTTRDVGNGSAEQGGYIIDNGYIYGNRNNGWTCLELATGKPLWTDNAGKIGKGSITYADGMYYLMSEKNGNAALAELTPKGLQLKGTVQVEGDPKLNSWAHPVIVGGRMYLRNDTNLYCFDVKAK
jgi:outer membrane protein assembly factor BamB